MRRQDPVSHYIPSLYASVFRVVADPLDGNQSAVHPLSMMKEVPVTRADASEDGTGLHP